MWTTLEENMIEKLFLNQTGQCQKRIQFLCPETLTLQALLSHVVRETDTLRSGPRILCDVVPNFALPALVCSWISIEATDEQMGKI